VEFAVKVGERIGAAADLFAKLREAGVNVLASCCYQIGDEAHLSFVPEDAAHAEEALRAGGMQPERQEVLLVELAHEPGAFAKLLHEIGAAGVNIRSAYVTATSSTKATAVLKTDDNARVLVALGRADESAGAAAREAPDPATK
jgi:hypothetical protein